MCRDGIDSGWEDAVTEWSNSGMSGEAGRVKYEYKDKREQQRGSACPAGTWLRYAGDTAVGSVFNVTIDTIYI